MEPRQLIWTSSGRRESVAEHSWRLAVMAMLVANEFPQLDVAKVLKMCLIHDWGEAIAGDIPAFDKTEDDERKEDCAIVDILKSLPDNLASEHEALFSEMSELKTEEAKLVKALDKLEV